MKKLVYLAMTSFLAGIFSFEVSSTSGSPSSSPSSTSPTYFPSSPFLLSSSPSSTTTATPFRPSPSTTPGKDEVFKKSRKGVNEEDEGKIAKDLLGHHKQFTKEMRVLGRGVSEDDQEPRQGAEDGGLEEEVSESFEGETPSGSPLGTGRATYRNATEEVEELARLKNPSFRQRRKTKIGTGKSKAEAQGKGQGKRQNTEFMKKKEGEEKREEKEEEEEEEEEEVKKNSRRIESLPSLQELENPQPSINTPTFIKDSQPSLSSNSPSSTSWTPSAVGTTLQTPGSLPPSGAHSSPSVGLPVSPSPSMNLLRVGTSSFRSSKRLPFLTPREPRVILATLNPPVLAPRLSRTEETAEKRKGRAERGKALESKSSSRYEEPLEIERPPEIRFQQKQKNYLGGTNSSMKAQPQSGSSQKAPTIPSASISSKASHKSSLLRLLLPAESSGRLQLTTRPPSTFEGFFGRALSSPSSVTPGSPTLSMTSSPVPSSTTASVVGPVSRPSSVSKTAPVSAVSMTHPASAVSATLPVSAVSGTLPALAVSATLPVSAVSMASLLRLVSPPPTNVSTMSSLLALPEENEIRDKASKPSTAKKKQNRRAYSSIQRVIFSGRVRRAAKAKTKLEFNVTANPSSSSTSPSPTSTSSPQEKNTRKSEIFPKLDGLVSSPASISSNSTNSPEQTDMTLSPLTELKTSTPTLPTLHPTPTFELSTPNKTPAGERQNSFLDVMKYATAQSNFSKHSIKYVTMDEFRQINLSEILKSPQRPSQSPSPSYELPGPPRPTDVLDVSQDDGDPVNTPVPVSTVPSTSSSLSYVTTPVFQRPGKYLLKKKEPRPRPPAYPLPLPPLIVVLPPACNLSQSSCFNLTLSMVHQVHEVAEKISSYHNQTMYNFDLDGYGSLGLNTGGSGGSSEDASRNGTDEDGNGPARRNDEQAFVYIIVVLAFYSSGIVFMMVKYMRKEWQEQEETKLYSQYVKAARERLITTNMRGNLANRLALQALNTANAVPQTTEGSKVTFV